MTLTWTRKCILHAETGPRADKLPGQTVLRYMDGLYVFVLVWVWTNIPLFPTGIISVKFPKAFLEVTHKKLHDPRNEYKWWVTPIFTVPQYLPPIPRRMLLLRPILSMTNLSYLREWALAYGGNHLEFLLLNGRLMGELIWKEPPQRNNEFQM